MNNNTGAYLARRKKVLQLMQPNSMILVPAAEYSPRPAAAHEIESNQLQASNFFYLSGYEDKQSLILLWRGQGDGKSKKEYSEQIIFSPSPNPRASLWTGELPTPAQLGKSMKFDQGLPLESFAEVIEQKLIGMENIYYPIGENTQLDNYLSELVKQLSSRGLRQGLVTPKNLKTSEDIFASMRLIKSPDELATIRLAAAISVGGHQRLAEQLANLKYEYQGEAELSYYYRSNAATLAFPSIVAAGKNACVLHYTKNDKPIKASDSLLVDSGATIGHYAADMTRCYPPRAIGSAKAEAYLAVYQEVLSVHKRLCKSVKVGMTLADLHTKSVSWLVDALLKLKIMRGDKRKIISTGAYKQYFPHLTSHWIGLDVHDLGVYKKQKLGKGMVFSIEPGLYIQPNDKSVASKWRGIGVRIEDTIAISHTGNAENLTQAMPYWQDK